MKLIANFELDSHNDINDVLGPKANRKVAFKEDK